MQIIYKDSNRLEVKNTNTNSNTNANANTKRGRSAYDLQTLGDADEETKKSDWFVVFENNATLTVLPIWPLQLKNIDYNFLKPTIQCCLLSFAKVISFKWDSGTSLGCIVLYFFIRIVFLGHVLYCIVYLYTYV